MLKELCLFAGGAAVGAAAMYYGSETVKENVHQTNKEMHELLGSATTLQYMVQQDVNELAAQQTTAIPQPTFK